MKKLIIVLFLFVSSGVCGQSVYYVTTTGSASNDGLSEGTAWSISHAFQEASIGDVVWIKSGIYPNYKIVQSNSGGVGNPITFRGYDNVIGDITTTTASTYVWNTPINGNTLPLIRETRAASGVGSGTGLTINGDYVVLENLMIQYYDIALRWSGNYGSVKNVSAHESGNFDPSLTSPPHPYAFDNYAGKGIQVFGSFNTLTNCYSEDAGAEGVTLRGSNNTFVNQQVHAKNTVNPTDYYFLVQAASNNTITNLTVWRHGNLQHYGHGIVLKSNSETTNNIFDGFLIMNTNLETQLIGVHGNIFRDGEIIKEATAGSSEGIGGLNLANDSHSNHYENIYLENCNIKFAAWDDSGWSGTASSSNNTFNQITVIPNWAAIHFFYYGNSRYSAPADNNKFYNCTFFAGYDRKWLFERSRANSGTEFVNCIFSGFTTYGTFRSSSPGYSVVATWTKNNLYNSSVVSIQGTQTGTTTVNPLFTNTATKDFSLQAGSPLLGQGVATPYLSAGNDLGAWQSPDGPPDDVTPPVITETIESLITETSIQVEFRFDEESTGQLEWGLTGSYGNFTTPETNYLTFHRQTITGLSIGTLYHYRVLGQDAAGNAVTGPDRTATTLGEGENPDPTPIAGLKDLRGKFIKSKKLF